MQLPETGYLRLYQIIGDRKRGVPALIPISRSAWYAGIKAGVYPKCSLSRHREHPYGT